MSYTDRMKKELDDLMVKVNALENFIESSEAQLLSKTNQHLLAEQRKAMVEYAKVLGARIAIQ